MMSWRLGLMRNRYTVIAMDVRLVLDDLAYPFKECHALLALSKRVLKTIYFTTVPETWAHQNTIYSL